MKKKLLFVINTMGRAGAERVLISVLKTLDPAVYDVDLLAVIPRGELFGEVPPHVRILNKTWSTETVFDRKARLFIENRIVYRLLRGLYGGWYFFYALHNLWLQHRRGGRLQFEKLFWQALSDAAPRFDTEYDLAIGYTEGAATYYVARHAKAKRKCSYVHVDYTAAGYMKAIDKPFYEKMDAIFAVSGNVRDNFVKVYPEHADKTKVLQNLVLPDEIRSKASGGKGFEEAFDGLRLLTVARLHPQKAFDIAIPAFAQAAAQSPVPLQWTVLGEGEQRSALEALIDQHGLQGRLILAGSTPNPYPFFAQCDIYVHATHFEGWCIALAEALVLGRPCIVSDFAGARDQINDGEDGLILDELTSQTLCAAILKLAGDPDLRRRFSTAQAARSADYARDMHLLYDLANS